MTMKYILTLPMMTDREALMQVKIIDAKENDKNAILCWVKTIDHKDYPE